MRIVWHEDRAPEFWMLMGPFFARREVRREMPYLVDEDGKIWALAMEGGDVLGFGAVMLKGRVAGLSGLWVRPARRGEGIGARLVRERVERAREMGAARCRATASPASSALLKGLGFVETARRGRYSVMEVDLDGWTVRERGEGDRR